MGCCISLKRWPIATYVFHNCGGLPTVRARSSAADTRVRKLDNGEKQRLPQLGFGFLPLALRQSDFTPESFVLNLILPRVGACGNLQATIGKLLRFGQLPASQPELPQAGEQVQGVVPFHPFASRRIMRQG